MYHKLVPIAVSALTVLILGMWNPVFMQKKMNGKSLGYSDPIWLALSALVTGSASAILLKKSKTEDLLRF